MNQEQLNTILEQHKKWMNNRGDGKRADLQRANLREANLQGANLQWADLREANLQWADLRRADLQRADLDFSSYPLWCGSKHINVDLKIIYQLLAHVACLDCKDQEFAEIKEKIMPYAKKSHRANELLGE
jgi:hypothetical protein